MLDISANAEKQEIGRRVNKRVENSDMPFRRRVRVLLRVWQLKALQKSASVHANEHHQSSQERHLVDRQTYRAHRWAALAEPQQSKA